MPQFKCAKKKKSLFSARNLILLLSPLNRNNHLDSSMIITQSLPVIANTFQVLSQLLQDSISVNYIFFLFLSDDLLPRDFLNT